MKMNLVKIAAIATIIGTIILIVQLYLDVNKPISIKGRSSAIKTPNAVEPYISGNDNINFHIDNSVPKGIPNSLISMKKNIIIGLNKDIYEKDRNWLLVMYNIAIITPSEIKKNYLLVKVVKSSLSIRDYNMAIIAANNMSFGFVRNYYIKLIVRDASMDNYESIGYALLASDLLEDSDKSAAYNLIIEAIINYAKFEQAGKNIDQYYKINKVAEGKNN